MIKLKALKCLSHSADEAGIQYIRLANFLNHRPIPCSEMGTSSPPPKRVEHPNFGPHLLWPNGCMDQDATWYGSRPRLDLRDIVFDVEPAIPRKKGHTHPTQFLAHIYCGHMAGWTKTPLGTEVDIGQGHIVLDGIPAPAKGAQQPLSLIHISEPTRPY